MIEFGLFLAYIAAVLAFAWLCVGAVVVTSFMVDVLVAAARAASMSALHLKVGSQVPGVLPWLVVLTLWRRLLIDFYRGRENQTSCTIYRNEQPIARWRGVFRWEFIKSGDQTSEVVK